MKKNALREIGKIIFNLRGGMTQGELARKCDVSRNIISNIENGKNYESKNLAKVLEALKPDLNQMIDTAIASEEEKRLHGRLHELLRAEPPWPTVAAYNVDSVYVNYWLKKKDASAVVGAPVISRKPSRNRQ